VTKAKAPPILSHKYYDAPSAFMPESLLREARRQPIGPEGIIRVRLNKENKSLGRRQTGKIRDRTIGQ
jgi:hypothetical protein